MKKMLITYASMSGSTAEVAEAIGNTLGKYEVEIEVRAMGDVQNVDAYEAIVVGAPMIIGWHRDAMRFVKTHQDALSKVPTAYFITCVELTRTDDASVGTVPIYLDPGLGHAPKRAGRLSIKEKRALPANYLEPALRQAPQIEPVSVGFFAGKIDYSKLKLLPGLFVRFIIRAKEGDRRNWEAIRTWAESLRQELIENT
jgi:menaquinone-dependent protoporphyrinogen oxidase